MQRVVQFLLTGIFSILTLTGWAQSCSTLGQTPFTAFPICGDSVFRQTTVPVCINGKIPTYCSNQITYDDRNPYWYKFTCFQSGNLGLLISPQNSQDDYDWQIFDITGHSPGDVYTDKSLIVSYNWSGLTGNTGATSQGQNQFECGSTTNPPTGPSQFSSMPNLVAGHTYLLMIGHFLGSSQSGYTLSIQGGTAVITDPTTPAIQNAYAVCDGTEIVVKINKKMKCSSVAVDGSDFTITGPVPITIVSASGNNCTNGFDMDSVTLKINRVLSPGKYTVTSKIGTDGNTLLDNCNNNLATGLQASLIFTPSQPTPLDSIIPVICIQDTLHFIFSKPMKCSSIAADGSDFTITGPTLVNIKAASGICTNGITTTINLMLNSPIRANGTYLIYLQNGSDGNTLIDECDQTTPAGSTLSFTTKNITTADFQSSLNMGCVADTVYLTHNAYGGTTQWQWKLDSALFSTLQNPVIISKNFGKHNLQLSVSNGFCTDTAFTRFDLIDQTVQANFSIMDTLCPTDTLHFTDLSSANAISWSWHFGNGFGSTEQFPAAQTYPQLGRQMSYTASLSVSNSLGCADTAYQRFTVLASCYIAVPSGFTPNGDGLNDYLYPLNAIHADRLVFQVFNRYGQRIFETRDWTRKWDGRVNGQLQPSGTYVWTLTYVEKNTGKPVSLQGTTVLIR